jgi:hypothetical protein
LLLLRRAALIANDASISVSGQAEESVALELVEELEGCRFALEQAGAFIEETPSSLSEYLSLYRAECGVLLKQRGSLGDHPSVAVTFSLAFAKVANNNRAAADPLRVCAFLAPEAIPEEIFSYQADELGETLAGRHATLWSLRRYFMRQGDFLWLIGMFRPKRWTFIALCRW